MMSWENFENVIRGLVHSGALRQQIGGSAQVCTVLTFVIQHRLSWGSILYGLLPQRVQWGSNPSVGVAAYVIKLPLSTLCM